MDDMYTFNPFGYTAIPSLENVRNVLHPELISNLCRDSMGGLWMNLQYKSGYRSYRLSSNISGVLMYAYQSKKNDKKFVKFIFGNRMMNVKYNDIRGYKLIDRLPMIGVEIGIDAPKNKKAEALNSLVIRSCLYNGFILLDEDEFNNGYKDEEIKICNTMMQ